MSTRYGFTLRTDNPRIYIEIETAGINHRHEQRWRVTVRKLPTSDGSGVILYRSLASSRSSAAALAESYCESIGVSIKTPDEPEMSGAERVEDAP